MNNNLTLNDLQNKYRDQKDSTKNDSSISVEPNQKSNSQAVKPSLPRKSDNDFTKPQTAEKTVLQNNRQLPAFQSRLNKVEKEPKLKSTLSLDTNKEKAPKIKKRKLTEKKKNVSDGPIMAFLLFSGLAMLGGVILLVADNIPSKNTTSVLGQYTNKYPVRSINSEIVKEVRSSIDSTNEKKQKEFQNQSSNQDTQVLISNTDNITQADSESKIFNSEDEQPQEVEVLEPFQEPEQNIKEINTAKLVRIKPNAQGGVNLRSEPNGAARASALSGEEYELVSESNGWIEIKFSETENYWVLSDLVEKL